MHELEFPQSHQLLEECHCAPRSSLSSAKDPLEVCVSEVHKRCSQNSQKKNYCEETSVLHLKRNMCDSEISEFLIDFSPDDARYLTVLWYILALIIIIIIMRLI